jgi:hypothetical protein
MKGFVEWLMKWMKSPLLWNLLEPIKNKKFNEIPDIKEYEFCFKENLMFTFWK